MTLAGAAFGIVRARHKDKKDATKESPLDLSACLHVLHASVLSFKALPLVDENFKKLRTTIHRVDESSEKVVQLVDYVGGVPDAEKKAGRKFSSRSGIVGRAITSTAGVAVMDRKADYDEYIAELQDSFHMPEQEARALARDRYSLMAVAIKHESKVIGVVYLDSSERGFFDKATVGMVVGACVGVAQYTKFRHHHAG